jgi:hypothetical protein
VSPASVVETERVVRASSRTFSRSSSPFIAWLKAGCDMPSLEAARVKLSSSATTAKAARSINDPRPKGRGIQNSASWRSSWSFR